MAISYGWVLRPLSTDGETQLMISLSHRLGRLAPVAFCAACLLAVSAFAAGGSDSDAAVARDAALKGDTTAWDIVEGLTTEIGPRLAATDSTLGECCQEPRQCSIAFLEPR